MEAPIPQQHKRIRDIVDRLEEFQGNPCEDLPQTATVVASGDAVATIVNNLDIYVAPPKPHRLRLVASEPTGERRETRAKPTTDNLGARISLIPRLLKEILVHPFGDFTLVKRNGRVFVVREGSDLKNADLTEANLRRANLRKADFQNALLVRANLEEADLRGANLEGADLRGANLRNADLRDAHLAHCNLRDADLRGAKVDINIRR